MKRYLFETKYTGIELNVKTTLNKARRILLCKYFLASFLLFCLLWYVIINGFVWYCMILVCFVMIKSYAMVCYSVCFKIYVNELTVIGYTISDIGNCRNKHIILGKKTQPHNIFVHVFRKMFIIIRPVLEKKPWQTNNIK